MLLTAATLLLLAGVALRLGDPAQHLAIRGVPTASPQVDLISICTSEGNCAAVTDSCRVPAVLDAN